MTLAAVAFGPVRFVNGWYCKQCEQLTEHRKVKGVQTCLICGTPTHEPVEYRVKHRAYRQRRAERLEKKLDAVTMEG